MTSVPDELQDALAYFEFTEEDRRRLRSLGPMLEKHADTLVSAFYRHLLSFPDTQALLREPAVKDRLMLKQRGYLLSLAGPTIDAAYIAERRRIGEVHERIGLEPRWYLGAYAVYLSMLTPLVCELVGADQEEAEHTVVALNKLLLFDAHIAMQTYIEQRERHLEYLNQELADAGRQMAHDLEQQGGELRRASQRAKAAERLASLGTLVAGLAHEIGTPMGVIQGHAKLLESAVRDEDGRWRLKTIQEQIARISRIIESLLNMARPRRERRVPVTLTAVLDGTVAFLSEKLERRAIRVVRDYAEVPSVHGDPERLQQLFLNLFLNAADAMPEGGELRIRLGRDDAGEIELSVADTGVGIPAEEVRRIFDPFVTSKPAGEGSGLGLAVAHGIVMDHDGAIEVTSEEGAGTEFRMVFPPAPTTS
jgi:signal transduction histidine kinase